MVSRSGRAEAGCGQWRWRSVSIAPADTTLLTLVGGRAPSQPPARPGRSAGRSFRRPRARTILLPTSLLTVAGLLRNSTCGRDRPPAGSSPNASGAGEAPRVFGLRRLGRDSTPAASTPFRGRGRCSDREPRTGACSSGNGTDHRSGRTNACPVLTAALARSNCSLSSALVAFGERRGSNSARARSSARAASAKSPHSAAFQACSPSTRTFSRFTAPPSSRPYRCSTDSRRVSRQDRPLGSLERENGAPGTPDREGRVRRIEAEAPPADPAATGGCRVVHTTSDKPTPRAQDFEHVNVRSRVHTATNTLVAVHTTSEIDRRRGRRPRARSGTSCRARCCAPGTPW